MEEHRLARALGALGVSGAAVAAGTLLMSALYATTPDGASPAAQLKPCFSPDCSRRATPASLVAPVRVAAAPARPKAPAPVARTPEARLAETNPVTWSNPVPAAHPGAAVVAMDTANGSLVMVGSDGGVFPIGRAGFYGSLGGKGIQSTIAAAAVDPSTGGYWLAGTDGSIFALNATFHGSLGKRHPLAPVTGMASTPKGDGYWLVTSVGGVYSFGAARYHGSLNGHAPRARIVDIVATPDGRGYWLVSQAGGVYAYGDAPYLGSLGAHSPSSPVVAMAPTTTGRGYWLVTAGGGVFAYGDASFEGGAVQLAREAPIAAIVSTPSNAGYWLADQAGEVFSFGDAVQVTTASRQPVRSAAAPLARRVTPPAPAATAATAAPAAPGPTNLERYSATTACLDISAYQCSNIPAAPTGVAIVQVTGGGLDEPPNPCYGQEAAWAGRNLSVYIYLDGLPHETPAAATDGPHGHCKPGMFACMSYNYGFNEAFHYVEYSQSLGIDPKLWWLDVERYSGWGAPGANALVIQGALDALKSLHLKTGIYSTAPQWKEITGDMPVHGVAEWVPGAGMQSGPGYTATNFCADPGSYTFGGGKLELVQYGYSGPFPGSYSGPTTYDQDYACN